MTFKSYKLNLTYSIIIIFVLWCLAFIFSTQTNISNSKSIADKLAFVDFIVQIISISILIREYRIFKYLKVGNDNGNLLFFIIINSWILLVNYLYYFAVFIKGTYLQNLSNLNFIFYYVPCIIYAIISIIFLSKIIIKNIINSNGWRSRITLLFIASIIIFYLYLSSIQYAYPILSFSNILQIILLFTEFILFDICLIGLIYATNINAFLMLIGFITLVIGDFFLTYTYISQSITKYFIIGEFLWCLGLIFLMFTAISIFNNRKYEVTKWFRNDKAIKSRLSFHVYLISIISYLIIYFISYVLGVINKQFFVLFPVLTMIYSIVTVILSIIVGKKFEEPFQILKNNIQNFLTDKGKYNATYTFDIEEFEYLEQFLVKVIEINNSHNQLYVSFGNIAAKAAHDLGSPLLSINAAISNIKNNVNTVSNLPALELSLTQVKEITNNLLAQYRTLTASNTYSPIFFADKNIETPRYIDIAKLIDDVVICKNIEWQQSQTIIKINVELNNQLYFFSPTKLSRVLSNLLNNAYESFIEKQNSEIIISCLELDNQLILKIKDNGIGIAKEKINEVLSGASFKHNGKGLGISSALEYVNSLNGTLSIDSILNKGTEVTLKFPIQENPVWLTTNITYSSESKFVILDDDPVIHMDLQLKLKNLGITSYHFADVQSYFKFMANLDEVENLNNLIYLIDLNLKSSNLDGLDIISKSQLVNNSRVYLMTSDAERLDVQNKVKLYKINLIHKNILNSIQFDKINSIQN